MGKSLVEDTQGNSLKTQLVDLKLRRSNRLLALTEDHPAVIAIDNEISFVEEQIKREVQLLKDLPSLIELAKKVYDVLPETHKGRNEIVRQVTRLRKDLIRLDVLCQDLEWGILQREVRGKYREDE